MTRRFHLRSCTGGVPHEQARDQRAEPVAAGDAGTLRPDRIRVNDLEGEDMLRQKAGADPRQRLLDQDLDGIDAEIIYPNKGLSMWATPDAIFAQAQCRVFNEWAWEQFG